MLRSIVSVGTIKILALVATSLCTIATVRILTDQYGSLAYGAVSLVASLVTLMPVADLGMSLVLTTMATTASATRSTTGLRLSMSVITWILFLSATVLALASTLIGVLGLWPRLLGQASLVLGDPDIYMPVFMLLCAAWIITSPGYRILTGLSKANTVVSLQAAGGIVAFGGTVVASAFHAPLIFFAFFPVVGALVAASVGWYIALRSMNIPARLIRPRRIHRRRYSVAIRTGLSGVMWVMGAWLMYAFDRVFVSHLATPHELGVYAANVPVFSAVQSALGSIGIVLWPHYTKLRIAKRLRLTQVTRHTALFAAVGVACAAAIIALFPVYLWITHATDPSGLMRYGIACVILVQAILLPVTSALTTERLLRVQGAGIFGALIVKLLLALVLVPWIGAAGMMFATVGGIVLAQLPVVTILAMRKASWPPVDRLASSSRVLAPTKEVA